MALSGPGAATGAKIGSVVPGVGTAIGAGIGSIFGGGGKSTWQPDPAVATYGPGGRGNNSLDYWIHSTQNPYVGADNHADQLNQQAWASYQANFGRAPTNQELAQAAQ